jgi:uncharacterized protein
MLKLINSKLKIKIDPKSDDEYKKIVSDLINNPVVKSMEQYMQHGNVSCLEHSIYVSYNSYLICKRLGLNYRAAARGGLLHDFFLYDWHTSKPQNGLHGFIHPFIALENANKYFELSDMEKDIIEKHMWPLTLKLPKYKESFIVSFVDKYYAFMESIKVNNREFIKSILSQLESI